MKRKRISKDEYYLNIAKAVSKRSTCLKRHYGAVIVNNDEIVATGYNGSAREEENCCDIHEHCPRYNAPHNQGNYTDCPAVHAEQNALLSASRSEIVNATLYLSGYSIEYDGEDIIEKELEETMPCLICSRLIKNSGITRIVGSQGEIKL